MNDFYVYAWLRPCGQPFYIGKGQGDRAEQKKYKNPIVLRIVDKMTRAGHSPTVVRLLENLTEDEAFESERALIRQYGRRNNGTGILANMTDGGEGATGAVRTPETRSRMSRAKSGVRFSAEHRAKLRAARRNQKVSEETRAKLSASSIGRLHTAESRAKIGNAHRGKVISEEQRARLRIANIGKKLSEETRAKIKLACGNPSPSARLKMSLAQRHRLPRVSFKGVSFHKKQKKWRAVIVPEGRQVHLGLFETNHEAARAYDKAAFEAWGSDCYLNFPEDYAREAA